MASAHPTKIQLAPPDHLRITWSDSVTHDLSIRQLRDSCPCATCREKRNAPAADAALLPVLTLEETKPLQIVNVKPVGNYAYGIHFSDGHDTGIFTLAFLREMGESQTQTENA